MNHTILPKKCFFWIVSLNSRKITIGRNTSGIGIAKRSVFTALKGQTMNHKLQQSTLSAKSSRTCSCAQPLICAFRGNWTLVGAMTCHCFHPLNHDPIGTKKTSKRYVIHFWKYSSEEYLARRVMFGLHESINAHCIDGVYKDQGLTAGFYVNSVFFKNSVHNFRSTFKGLTMVTKEMEMENWLELALKGLKTIFVYLSFMLERSIHQFCFS